MSRQVSFDEYQGVSFEAFVRGFKSACIELHPKESLASRHGSTRGQGGLRLWGCVVHRQSYE